MTFKTLTFMAGALGALAVSCVRSSEPKTYCNPLDIDYSYMVYNSDQNLSYRSGADPAVAEFRGEYYMFVTRSHGYWHSKDLTEWEFVEPKSIWYPQGCNAPAVRNYKDSVLFMCGDPSGEMSVLYSDDPASGVWKATPLILHSLVDPDLFIDDDSRAYIYWGSSNVFPIKGKELDMHDRFKVVGPEVELFNTDSALHGWERFGENHSDTRIDPFIEGPWMSKHEGKYYLQYAAPGTEFNVYGDGVYVGDSPLGPFEYQAHNPFCYKPGGFINGAGHGCSVEDTEGRWWHFATMSLSAVVNWERRLCMYPTFFDKDGILYSDTSFGDYPHVAPSVKGSKGEFAQWFLLSLDKPVLASSYAEGSAAQAQGFADWNRPKTSSDFRAENLTDENCKSYWLAATNSEAEYFTVDLQDAATVYALQINYYDHYAGLYGRPEGLSHRFIIEGSLDGEKWFKLEDRSRSAKDSPNAYIELKQPRKARYVRYRNVKVPSESLAISEFRVFGKGTCDAPAAVANFKAVRGEDRREAHLSWDAVEGAQGYNIRWGIAPDKLYSSWLLYARDLGDSPEFTLPSLSCDQSYYFVIESFNTGGLSAISGPLETK